jgi:uncharacterized protein
MTPTLNEIERRVLGVLLEKALSQPQYYPMSLNAIVAACNQKSNRDPLMDLDENAVWNTLEVMRAGGLVSRLLPGGASRVERYKHEVKEHLGWEKPQRAVMAELLLRGPQTIGELRSHSARMYPFENVESVTAVIERLSQGEAPMVAMLARAPGQSAVRYAHRMYSPAEWAALAGAASTPSPLPTAPVARPPVPARPEPPGELAALRDEVHELRAAVEELRARLARVEGTSGTARPVE